MGYETVHVSYPVSYPETCTCFIPLFHTPVSYPLKLAVFHTIRIRFNVQERLPILRCGSVSVLYLFTVWSFFVGCHWSVGSRFLPINWLGLKIKHNRNQMLIELRSCMKVSGWVTMAYTLYIVLKTTKETEAWNRYETSMKHDETGMNTEQMTKAYMNISWNTLPKPLAFIIFL